MESKKEKKTDENESENDKNSKVRHLTNETRSPSSILHHHERRNDPHPIPQEQQPEKTSSSLSLYHAIGNVEKGKRDEHKTALPHKRRRNRGQNHSSPLVRFHATEG